MGQKNPVPCLICWDRMKIQPAVPPGLTHLAPTYAYQHMQTFVHGESCSVAHTLDKSISDCPRKSIQSYINHPALTNAGFSVDKVIRLTYSFSTVLLYYMPAFGGCQHKNYSIFPSAIACDTHNLRESTAMVICSS